MSDDRMREPPEKPYESDAEDVPTGDQEENLSVSDVKTPDDDGNEEEVSGKGSVGDELKIEEMEEEDLPMEGTEDYEGIEVEDFKFEGTEEEIDLEEDLLEKFEETMKDLEESTISDSVIDCDEHSMEEKTEEEEYKKLVSEEWVSGLVPDLRSAYLQSQELSLSDENFTGIDKTILVEAATQAKGEMILDEDNPMVKKFQEVLKTHLLRHIEKIKNNIQELEGEYKKQEIVYKADTEDVFKAEQIVLRQRENLDNYKEKIEQVSNLRKRIENDIKKQDEGFSELKKILDDKKVEMDDSQAETEMLSELVKKMSEYDREQEREIILSKRQQDINLKDRERLAKEKQALDMTLWRLQKNILAKKRETETRLNKCKIKSQECQVISNKLLQATVERAGLLMENQTISKELQKSFLRIKQTDSILQKTKDELEEAKTNWGKLKMSLRWYKKHTKILMEQNAQLLDDKRRTKDEYEFYNEKLEMMKEKKYRAVEELNSFDELMKTADKDLNDVIQMGLSLQADEDAILKQITKTTSEKLELEKAYLEKLSSLERTDKIMKNMNAMIAKMVEEHQKQELKMYKVENNVSKLMVELEEVKGLLREIEFEIDSVNRLTRETEEALKAPDERLKFLKNKEMKLKNNIIEKKKELEKLELAWKHKTYLDTPLFTKKRNIQYHIKQLQTSIEEKESLWMQMQEGCLRATKKRNEQLEKINCLKKQICMMETSLERTSQKIKKEQVELREIVSELKAVTHRMEHLQEAEVKQGQVKIKAEESNKDREDEFIDLLKTLEKTVMTIQQEIWNLEERNMELTESVEMLQKELLEWNKKYNLAIQMKKEMELEKSKGGEVAAMKQEIHRMEVRYANLRKAEEKLINDLELCLSRRDSIVDSAEAREKRAKACGITSRVFAWRKMEETKAKLRTMIRTVRELNQEKEACLTKRKELSEELNFWRSSVERLSQSLQQLEQQIQEGQLHRHKTLEMTVMRQRKSKLLEELRMGRYRVVSTEDNLAVQTENVYAIRNALLHIVDELKKDFPTLTLQLIQLENTISYNIDPNID